MVTSLTLLEDFMALGMNNLIDFRTVQGLKTSGRKVELVACSFSAVELKLPILWSSEEQQKQLKFDYEKCLQIFMIENPLKRPSTNNFWIS